MNLVYWFKENNIWAKYLGQSEKLLGACWGTHGEPKNPIPHTLPEREIILGWTPATLRSHNSLPKPPIGMGFEANL